MKRSMILVIALLVLFMFLIFHPASFASNFITADSPNAYSIDDYETSSLENSTNGGGSGKKDKPLCFTMSVELSLDGSQVLVYASNRCENIVKVVRFSVSRVNIYGGISTGYYRPDVYIEEGVGSLIHQEPHLQQRIEYYAIGDYFEVNQKIESNHLIP